MEIKLRISADKFHKACLEVLGEKEKKGWIGWDDENNKGMFRDRIVKYALGSFNQRNLIHLANFCGFLWNLKGKEEK